MVRERAGIPDPLFDFARIESEDQLVVFPDKVDEHIAAVNEASAALTERNKAEWLALFRSWNGR